MATGDRTICLAEEGYWRGVTFLRVSMWHKKYTVFGSVLTLFESRAKVTCFFNEKWHILSFLMKSDETWYFTCFDKNPYFFDEKPEFHDFDEKWRFWVKKSSKNGVRFWGQKKVSKRGQKMALLALSKILTFLIIFSMFSRVFLKMSIRDTRNLHFFYGFTMDSYQNGCLNRAFRFRKRRKRRKTTNMGSENVFFWRVM